MVRVAEAIGGDLEVEVDFRPRPEYGLVTPRLVERDGHAARAFSAARRVSKPAVIPA